MQAPPDAMNILLHAPRDFNNLCVLVRTLECFGITRCAVYDPHQLVRERYGRSYAKRLRIVSAGAFPRVALQRGGAGVGRAGAAPAGRGAAVAHGRADGPRRP